MDLKKALQLPALFLLCVALAGKPLRPKESRQELCEIQHPATEPYLIAYANSIDAPESAARFLATAQAIWQRDKRCPELGKRIQALQERLNSFR